MRERVASCWRRLPSRTKWSRYERLKSFISDTLTYVMWQVDPIEVLMDKLYSFVDLDRNIVSEEGREALYKQLEETALNQEATLLMFEAVDNALVQVPLDTDSDHPKTLLIKPVTGSIKVGNRSKFY